MIRVYLDWNVYSRIKTSNKDFYPELRNILLDNDKYCFPFSTAHLMDIYESYSKVGWSNIQSHLEKLNLSKNLNIKHIFGEEISFYISEPIDELKSYISQKNPSEKFGEFNDNSKSDNIDYFPEATKFLKQQEEISKIRDKIISTFQNNLNSLLGENFKEDYQEGMKISKGKLLNKNTDKIDYFNKIAISAGFTDFKSHIEEILSKVNKNPELTDEISTLFTAIDISGYGQDNKNLSSTITDSLHCAYASTCDIFIVDDNKTYLKSKEVYRLKNLVIKTFRPKEFIDNYYNNNLEFDDGKQILEFAFNIPKLIKPILVSKSENIFYLESYLFDYFNIVSINNDELVKPIVIQMHKLPANNKLGLLSIEKEDLLKKLNLSFGEPILIKDSWRENGILYSAWLYKKIKLIKLRIEGNEVGLSFEKCKEIKAAANNVYN
jgi:hypothetical protein